MSDDELPPPRENLLPPDHNREVVNPAPSDAEIHPAEPPLAAEPPPAWLRPVPRPTDYSHLRPHRGAVTLTFGVLGLSVIAATTFFLCCPVLQPVALFFSVPAWLIGRADIRWIDEGRMDPSGRGLAIAGYLLGVFITVVCVLLTLLFVIGAVWWVGLLQDGSGA